MVRNRVQNGIGKVKDSVRIRTSESHPITVSWILEHSRGGKVGLCFCPGKKVTRGGVIWERNLKQDLTRLREEYGITTMACLLNSAELTCFELRQYPAIVGLMGFGLLEFPIVEMAPPECADKTTAFVGSILNVLETGQSIAIHCRGGVGRAGVIAACILLELGLVNSGEQAIAAVRRLRCKTAVESHSQEKFVNKYAEKVSRDSEGKVGEQGKCCKLFAREDFALCV